MARFGSIAFLLEADHRVREHRGHGLVVGRAARVEEAVFFDELERIALPVGAIGFDHVDVREQQQRASSFASLPGSTAIEIAVLRPVGRHDDVQLRRRRIPRRSVAPSSHSAASVHEPTDSVVLISTSSL